ncbi:NSS family neurotransmitter:Na+ symporter [Salsuginibacillus halophilus]|uniref:NSS family neurotransmitter:Na+ symporter n=1 Tax=Salsuginibacillus halophilus TaxID=517424 RepID=A0A2P8HE37_9BACI|nr:sodium-dependent transporter [Salsuginibacillus halophilus]PSL44483.1 NSS family neurotransmitter:Na+ symporter [Salsuginibacillus halophilus]
MSQRREQWASRLGFILAAAGSAIGLGAVWKLPYVAGTNGGGAFFFIFILLTLTLGASLMLAEFILGRHTNKDAIQSYKAIAPGTPWFLVGALGIVASFLLLSFYAVVGGWIVTYFFRSITGQLQAPDGDFGALFGQITANPWEVGIAHFVFILITIFVVRAGIRGGIERASKLLMPALFILFLVIVARSLTLDGAMEGVRFFLQPDFSEVTGETLLFALGQAFFALSLGVSIMVTYSSYVPKDTSLTRSAGSIIGLSLFIALLSGLAIFPAVFSLGMSPEEGPPLIFIVLPAVFNEMAFGGFFFTLFLALLLFATLTSAFSLLEILVAPFAKNDLNKRKRVTWISGLLVYIMGIPSALSFGILGDFTVFGNIFFDNMDFLVSNILLPLGALLIALFVPWKINKDVLEEELLRSSRLSRGFFLTWLFTIRFVTPAVIVIVFLYILGFLPGVEPTI